MAITLGSFVLPDGLVWTDELNWTPVVQSNAYSLTGALIVQRATRLAGRPITLSGQKSGDTHTAWMSRADILSLQSLVEGLTVDAPGTLTLHDGRSFSVIANIDGNPPLSAELLPAVGSFIPANPDSDSLYSLTAIRLITV